MGYREEMLSEPKTIIETVVPLDIDQIQNLYTNRDKVYFVIDYDKSSLKEQGLLFYMSNLELPGNVYISPDSPIEDRFALIAAYMNLNNMIRLPTIELAVAQILFTKKDVPFEGMIDRSILTVEETYQFIEEHEDLVNRWTHIMDSMYVYALFVVMQGEIRTDNESENRQLVEQNTIYNDFPHVDDLTYVGINFINVFNIPGFSEIYFSSQKPAVLSFFKYQFTEYCYKGENLYNLFMESDGWLLSTILLLTGRSALPKETAIEEDVSNV